MVCKRNRLAAVLAVCAAGLITTAVWAAVTFDVATGLGFVGKGDVQLVYGWNNAALQKNATKVAFRYVGTTTSSSGSEWTCTRTTKQGKELYQERNSTTTTTTSTEGLVNGITRDSKNQVTGFNLLGYSGGATTSSSSTTDGPSTGSCANDGSNSAPSDENWTLVPDSLVTTEEQTTTTGGLQVSFDGGAWNNL